MGGLLQQEVIPTKPRRGDEKHTLHSCSFQPKECLRKQSHEQKCLGDLIQAQQNGCPDTEQSTPVLFQSLTIHCISSTQPAWRSDEEFCLYKYRALVRLAFY